MADQTSDPRLEALVQRMIDNNEPEENIGTVIKEYQKEKSGMEAKGFKQDSSAEPDTYLGGALTGAREGMIHGAEGFVNGLENSPVSALKSVGSVLAATPAAAKYLLTTSPEDYAAGVGDAISKIPSAVSGFVRSEANKAATDPEGFGEQVGDITGKTMMGGAVGEAGPALSTVSRTAGKALELVGKTGQWPMRMVGAHQLGEGNPAGVLTMGGPEALRYSGKALRLLAGPEADSGYVQRFTDAFDKAQSGLSPQEQQVNFARAVQLAHKEAAAGGTFRQRLSSDSDAKAASGDVKAELSARKQQLTQSLSADAEAQAAAQRAADNQTQLDAIKQALADSGAKPGKPGFTETSTATTPEGSTIRMAVSHSVPTPETAGVDASALAALRKRGFSAEQAQQMLTNGRVVPRDAAVQPTPAMRLVPSHGPAPIAAEQNIRINPQTGQSFAGDSPTKVPFVAPAISHEPTLPVSGNGGSPTGSSLGDAILSGGNGDRVPVTNVPPTRTSRDLSATEGLSANDMKVLGLNPSMKVTAIKPDMVDKILQYRKERGMNYRDLAALEARLKALLAQQGQ